MSEQRNEQPTTVMVQSFRVVFRLERRLHKIDRFRVPLPYGVPVVAIGYGVVLLLVVVVLQQLPIAGALLGVLPPPLRYLILPCAGAAVLTRTRPDGRSAHAFLRAWIRHRSGPRYLNAFRAVPAPGTVERVVETITLAPDTGAGRLRQASLRGPARILLRYPFEATRHGARLDIRQTSDRPRWRGSVIELAPDQKLRMR